jgi:hypothetical protein
MENLRKSWVTQASVTDAFKAVLTSLVSSTVPLGGTVADGTA